jgi:hypothetical protein
MPGSDAENRTSDNEKEEGQGGEAVDATEWDRQETLLVLRAQHLLNNLPKTKFGTIPDSDPAFERVPELRGFYGAIKLKAFSAKAVYPKLEAWLQTQMWTDDDGTARAWRRNVNSIKSRLGGIEKTLKAIKVRRWVVRKQVVLSSSVFVPFHSVSSFLFYSATHSCTHHRRFSRALATRPTRSSSSSS